VPAVREYVVVKREPLLRKTCPACGQTFQGLSRQRYCSPNCRHRADYQRHAEQRRAYQRQKWAKERSRVSQ
jgi:tRNA(Ile2) C34 agmatinyltransferase TiaS